VVAPELSLAEKRLILALPKDGSALPAAAVPGFATEGEALLAAGGAGRHGFVDMAETATASVAATAEGRRLAADGLPEARALAALKAGPLPLPALVKAAGLSEPEARIIVGLVKRTGAADSEKAADGLVLRLNGKPPAGIADLEAALRALGAGAGAAAAARADLVETLVSRGLAQKAETRSRALKLTPAGQAFAKTLKPEDAAGSEVNQVTPELIAAWPAMTAEQKARTHLRPFDTGVDVAVPAGGKPHPLTAIVQEIRDIFVALGFQEIAGDYVEPAFWNMDALFIPQDHPAREMQDTFYVKEPARLPVDGTMFEAIREVQTTGGKTGSTGWGGSFKREESERPLLRTHTTVTTIRHLAAHPAAPTRVFGIGRVFRNEAMDATHLPEFHQVEGIVVEEGATLSMLMGILGEFYKRMGFPEVKFRPSFYPYTEPSLDVAVKWNGRWLELGGAGVFRPEVTGPLGVKAPVLAWGLGLERLAMLRLGLTDIRQLYLSDVQWLRESPVR
jgi:phenylalanyl-tRNA synthetase alpha chain